MKRIILICLFLAAAFALALAAEAPKQPVYVVLYSRFFDHSHQNTTNERLQRLLPMLERMRQKYPASGASALVQFSGTVSNLLTQENGGMHLVDRVKAASEQGLVDIGYTGEDEPSYLYRPKPELLLADTPEKRWTAKAEAAHKFLVDFKNPVTGQPVSGLTGGLARTREVFGNLAFISGLSTSLGGNSPAVYEAEKLNPGAMMVGIPGSDPRRGIEGAWFSSAQFSKAMSPDADESPEVYWEDNILRLSDTTFGDNRPHSTEEGPQAIKKIFTALDRSHVRVIKLEVASYKRYFNRRADGSYVVDPMEWLYFHPDNPSIPLTMKATAESTVITQAYDADEATLNWLASEFLPANPGSRFISIRDLQKMAHAGDAASRNPQVSEDRVRAIAEALRKHFASISPQTLPDFVKTDRGDFSLAESFAILSRALESFAKSGKLPDSVPMPVMYGPLTLSGDRGPFKGSVAATDVIMAASQLAQRLYRQEMRAIPENAVPAFIQVGSERLNASQLMELMAQIYLDPTAAKSLPLNAMDLATRAAFMFPKNTPMIDAGNAWTYRPAALQVESATAMLAAR